MEQMSDFQFFLATTCTAAAAMVAGLRAHRHAPAGPKLERRDALWSCVVPALTASVVDVEAAHASSGGFTFTNESRTAYIQAKAKQINGGVDLFLFDARPTIFRRDGEAEIPAAKCEEMGVNCPTIVQMDVLAQMYKLGQTGNAGGGAINLTLIERELIYPMKDIALAPVVDPDTSDDLREIFTKFELSQGRIGLAAAQKNLTNARAEWNKSRDLINEFFEKVNTSLGTDFTNKDLFFVPIPVNAAVIENERYWQRRLEKFNVKKKVDAVSKANKTARFYAKSIFGPDAESWDPRGDRAKEFFS